MKEQYGLKSATFSFPFQEIPPYETKTVMKANFVGRVENNHTAFIRIKTNQEQMNNVVILPVEVEVSSGKKIDHMSYWWKRIQDAFSGGNWKQTVYENAKKKKKPIFAKTSVE